MALFRPTYIDKKTGDKKQSAMWWIDFTIGDKRVRQSAETTRKTIALEFEKKRRLELERSYAGLPAESAQRRISTVGELVEKYLGDYHINHRPQSLAFARNRLAHVRRALGTLFMPSLTEDSIRAYIKDRLAAGVGGRTINMELGELSRALGHKWSVIWPKVRKLEENHDVGQALSAEQETRLLTTAQEESPNRNPVLYPFLCIALSTGMRSGEITALRWSHIDLDSSLVTVTKKAKTKAGAGRVIPINADLRAVLEEHLLWYLRKLGEIDPEWYVFPGRAGRPQKGQDRPLDPSRVLVQEIVIRMRQV
jgi:integrase